MNKLAETKNHPANVPNSADSLPNLPSQNQAQIFTAFAGPIPPPNYLEQYEKLVPGSAKRFLEEPHLEAQHRRELENLMVNQQINLSIKGQWMAFLIATFCTFSAFIAIFLGYDIAGLGALFLSISAFTGVFIYGKYKSKE